VDVGRRFQGEFFQGYNNLVFNREQDTGYAYSTFSVPDDLNWTVGLSYESYRESQFRENEYNPKLGLQWSFTDALSLRLAYFETLKRPLIFDQTLEPTQVAGFNQFFDDFNGTKTTRYGMGIDYRPGDDLYSGVEISKRDLKVTSFDLMEVPVDPEKQKEYLYRAYCYWMAGESWALSTEVQFERFKRDAAPDPDDVNPVRVNTFSAPLTLSYSSPTGIYAKVRTSYIHQAVDRLPTAVLRQGSDSFVIVDPVIGYRLPRRRGFVTLETRNLFDKNFMFQDDNFRTSETRNSPYIPDRIVLGRLTLNF
jgi:outer membrane receptor protein involved in Fe transport